MRLLKKLLMFILKIGDYIMIKILHCVSNMDRAGIETMIMNFYRHIDRNKFSFDFLCNKAKKGHYDDEIRKLGGKIYVSPGLNPLKFFRYKKFLKKIVKENNYDIIHAHNGSFAEYALLSIKHEIPIRIFHAHGTNYGFGPKVPLKMLCHIGLKHDANVFFACSDLAAKFYFSKKVYESKKFYLIHNAVEVKKFLFNVETRKYIRKKYNLENKLIIGNIGRFVPQKNQLFLIDLFRNIIEYEPNARLVLLGDGPFFQKIKFTIEKMNIVDKVLLIGNVDNANEWYQAFDVFVMPSIWEGLPVVGIEAQISGLKCVFSNNVTKEVKINNQSTFLNLNSPKEIWIDNILTILKEKYDRQIAFSSDFEYDIFFETKKLENIYENLILRIKK